MSPVVIPPPERIKADVDHLKDWIAKEPHLPLVDDEEWLKTFLYMNKFSLEKSKSKLDSYYFLRTKYPEYFTNRDPTGADMIKLRPLYKVCIGHKLSRDGSLVIHLKHMGEPSDLETAAVVKKLVMLWDLICLDTANRLIHLTVILDLGDAKPMMLLKLATIIPVLVEIGLKAYSFRVKVFSVINFPSLAQKFYEAGLKLIPEKIGKRFVIHKDANTLLEMVDEDVVSSDFGGKGPSLDDLEEQTLKRLEQARQWFKEQDSVCSNEGLRSKNSNEPEDMQGSFRKLTVD